MYIYQLIDYYAYNQLAGISGIAQEWNFLKILPLAPAARPRSPRGHTTGK